MGCNSYFYSLKKDDLPIGLTKKGNYDSLVFDTSNIYSYKRFTWASELNSSPEQSFSSATSLEGQNRRFVVDVQALIFFPKDSVVIYLPSVGYKYLCRWAQNTSRKDYDLDDVRKIRLGKYKVDSLNETTAIIFYDFASKKVLKWRFTGMPGKNPYYSKKDSHVHDNMVLKNIDHVDERTRDTLQLTVPSFVFENSYGAKIHQSNPYCNCENLELENGSIIRYTKLKYVKSLPWYTRQGLRQSITFEMHNTSTSDTADIRWNTFTNRVTSLPDR